MAGLGIPGPIGNRSDDLARPRERKGGDQIPVTKGEARPVTIPEPDENWHEIAKLLWESLKTSGQSDFYQNSDWALAYSICDDLSYYKKPLFYKDGTEYHKRSGQMLQTIYSAMERLLVSEGDRRRVRIELSAPQVDEDDVGEAAADELEAGLGLAEVIPIR